MLESGSPVELDPLIDLVHRVLIWASGGAGCVAIHPELSLDVGKLLLDQLADRGGDSVTVISITLGAIVTRVIADPSLVLRVVTLDRNAQRKCVSSLGRAIDVPARTECDCSCIVAVLNGCGDCVNVWGFNGDAWTSAVADTLGDGVLDFSDVDHFYLWLCRGSWHPKTRSLARSG